MESIADDCNLYIKSKKSALRVMESITRFIEKDLKLRVNREKSKVDRLWKLKYLGDQGFITLLERYLQVS